MPAKAGIQNHLKILDPRLRGNDAKGGSKTFYETIKIEYWKSKMDDGLILIAVGNRSHRQ